MVRQRLDYRGHGGRPTIHVVPVGSVTADVDVVATVGDVVEPAPPDALVALVALANAPDVYFGAPDPVTPGGGVSELPDPASPVPFRRTFNGDPRATRPPRGRVRLLTMFCSFVYRSYFV